MIDALNLIIDAISNSLGKMSDRNGSKNVAIPAKMMLEQNYPNPFNPTTSIRFTLPEARHVVLKICNSRGQEIRTLADECHTAGFHTVRWDGRDNFGSQVASGLYLHRLEAGEVVATRKLMLAK